MARARTLTEGIERLRQLCGIGTEGQKRHPTDRAELRQFCLRLRDWISKRREELLSLTPLGEQVLAQGCDYTLEIEVTWHHLVRIAGTDRYPSAEPGPYARDRAVAALDRIVNWCDDAASTAVVPIGPANPAGREEPRVMPISRGDLPNICSLSDELLRLIENLPRALRALQEARAKGQFDPHALSPRGFVVGTPGDALETVRMKLLKALAPSKDEGEYFYAGGDSDITDSDLDLRQKVALKALFQLCADTGRWHMATSSRREESILQLMDWRQTLHPVGLTQEAGNRNMETRETPPEQLSVGARAVALMMDRHKKTGKIPKVQDIADAVGVNRGTLYRNKEFKVARSALRAGAVPKGFKDAKRNVDAVLDEDEE